MQNTWLPQPLTDERVETPTKKVSEVWSITEERARLIAYTDDPATVASYEAQGYVVL